MENVEYQEFPGNIRKLGSELIFEKKSLFYVI